MSLAALFVTLLAQGAAQRSPRALLDGAIAASGGADRLNALVTIEWEGKAVLHAGGRDIAIGGTWRVRPPDSAVVATFPTVQGPAATRRMTLSGTTGTLRRDTVTTPMPPDVLAEERHQFYLYALLRLVPLRDPDVRLTAVARDSAGRAGIRVERPGRLPVHMYFDTDGRVARLATRFATETGAPGDSQDIALAGVVPVDGASWFKRLEIRRNGRPYFDLDVLSARRVTP